MLKNNGHRKRAPYRQSDGTVKSKVTRERILAAARDVFTRYPYSTASMRMVAEAGGFQHSLIRYHFGSKKGLFEELVARMDKELLDNVTPMLDGIMERPLHEILELFVDRFLEFNFREPDSMRAIMLNVGEVESLNHTLPGLDTMQDMRLKVLRLFSTGQLARAPERASDMWLSSFVMSVSNYVGAAAFHAGYLGFDSESAEYRDWVRSALLFLYYPALESLAILALTGGDEPPSNPPEHDPWGQVRLQDVDNAGMTKGEVTRARILAAARRVFSMHPYDSASIRTIGREAGLDYTLIHHYFPAKADLFEAVAEELYLDFSAAAPTWFDGLAGMPLRQSFSLYLDRVLDYCFRKQEGLAILVQNVAQTERLEDLPGLQHLTRLHTEIRELSDVVVPRAAGEGNVDVWQYGIITLTYQYTGASAYPARILGLGPASAEYRQWLKDMLMLVFYPTLKRLFLGGNPKE